MKLTEKHPIIIPKEKITEYLLSLTHTKGKYKARYFYNFGFTVEKWELFSDAIKEIVENININKTFSNKYGTTFIVEGNIKTPFNADIKVRTVWIVLLNQNNASLVTVYPIK